MIDKKEIPFYFKLAAILLCVSGSGILLYIFIKHLLPYLLPFIIAFLISLITVPASKKISQHFKLPLKLCCVIVTGVFLFIAGASIYLTTSRLVYEAGHFLSDFGSEGSPIAESFSLIFDYITTLISRIPFFSGSEEFSQYAEQVISSMISKTIESINNREADPN